jgi:hypothetical protein
MLLGSSWNNSSIKVIFPLIMAEKVEWILYLLDSEFFFFNKLEDVWDLNVFL